MSDEPLYCPGCGREQCLPECTWAERYAAAQASPSAPPPSFDYCELCGAKEPCTAPECQPFRGPPLL